LFARRIKFHWLFSSLRDEWPATTATVASKNALGALAAGRCLGFENIV
jgi:hypothetical protein